MDADLITIETSHSDMELLSAFVNFSYPNEIGPGVYDIHSPRIPSTEEIEVLLEKAIQLLPPEKCLGKSRLWIENKKMAGN